MKKTLALLCSALFLNACGGSDDSGPTAPDLGTADKITTYLDGKVLTMTGVDLPSHPNGYNEDVNYGAATQCYESTVITVGGTTWNVSSEESARCSAPRAWARRASAITSAWPPCPSPPPTC
ncbi:MAG: hypothetical protein QM767_21655 [Anaeromyxobacter sp.]